ncbi:MAG: helix-turn-helix domain-containing protein [Polyangiales bacterium]
MHSRSTVRPSKEAPALSVARNKARATSRAPSAARETEPAHAHGHTHAHSHEHQTPPARSSVGPAALERAAGLFRAAGEPSRLRLLELLSQGELCVTEVAAITGEELSTISQRLRVLRAEHLVTRRRDGKHIFYALADEHVAALLSAVLAHASESPAQLHAPSDEREPEDPPHDHPQHGRS